MTSRESPTGLMTSLLLCSTCLISGQLLSTSNKRQRGFKRVQLWPLGELYFGILEKSKVLGFPAGVCTTVGASGHISGGGYCNMMRKYGLSSDHMIDAQIVDANGSVLDRKSMGEDLFWAVRGGEGASFGVILSYTLKLVPVPETVTVFRMEKTLEQNGTDIVYRWQNVADKIDNDLFMRMHLNPVKSTITASFESLFLGN
ncbi:hypothetical protein L1049_024860 [Liquidambar formosana]|uniref:FAD-binding PCMH-type domain-containing protein n=1 Tax=Liquidambar formosana TaxID=63359 RepID=A0AAP0S1A5_LIQFO